MPGCALGIHTTMRLVKTAGTPSSHIWLYVSIFYGVVALLELAYLVKVCLPTAAYQNSAMVETAWRNQRVWRLYYYGILVATPSQMISLIYAGMVYKKKSQEVSDV
mgnify:CR=1 FL=1